VPRERGDAVIATGEVPGDVGDWVIWGACGPVLGIVCLLFTTFSS
jgi:hypothetical protein